jgi:hypothetical protein
MPLAKPDPRLVSTILANQRAGIRDLVLGADAIRRPALRKGIGPIDDFRMRPVDGGRVRCGVKHHCLVRGFNTLSQAERPSSRQGRSKRE